MQKIAVGPGLPQGVVDLDAPAAEDLRNLARAKKVDVSDLVVCLLDRERHEEIVAQCRQAGAHRRGVRGDRAVLVEILNYQRDGQPFRNAVLVAPIYDEQDALLYFLGSQVEIDADAAAPSSMRRIRATEMVKALSPRQGQVLRLVANGLLNKQIAAELGLAEKTVKMHRAILMDRLGLRSTADLIRLAVEAGL